MSVLFVAALVLLAGLIVFQVAAACGAKVGRYTQGGRSAKLTAKQRIFAGVSIFVLIVTGYVLSAKAGFINTPLSPSAIHIASIIFALYFSANVVMNILSRSKQERFIMTPIAAIIALAFWL